ncbi:MAG: glycosyltransferase family 2 protein [Planctomycetes bacterium]|nr:glycosyltransferase family 2 protein [Planctomycetota bacterium]
MLISAVLPCYNEEENLPPLYERLARVAAAAGGEWEFVFVDDHSTDRTPQVLRELAARDPRVKSVRFSRNFGSHAALAAGMAYCTGDAAVILAADGQDPPEDIPLMTAKWREGFDVVWAVRAGHTDPWYSRLPSMLYWTLLRRLALPNTPPAGADMLLVDRKVMDVVNAITETNSTTLGLILWSGFEQACVNYTKQARMHGRSKWTLGRKIKFAIDSLVSFSYVPIRLMSYLGVAVSTVGFLVAFGLIVQGALHAALPSGWTGVLAVLLVLGGVQMMMLGMLGEYLWRALDETRARPRYIVASTVGVAPKGLGRP